MPAGDRNVPIHGALLIQRRIPASGTENEKTGFPFSSFSCSSARLLWSAVEGRCGRWNTALETGERSLSRLQTAASPGIFFSANPIFCGMMNVSSESFCAFPPILDLSRMWLLRSYLSCISPSSLQERKDSLGFFHFCVCWHFRWCKGLLETIPKQQRQDNKGHEKEGQ